MSKSATICIGNSDDKLKQTEWSEFVCDVQKTVEELNFTVHFHGLSLGSARWQNACWVIGLDEDETRLVMLAYRLSKLAYAYHQDSVALAVGETTFVEPSGG